jgi:hypothetical protein
MPQVASRVQGGANVQIADDLIPSQGSPPPTDVSGPPPAGQGMSPSQGSPPPINVGGPPAPDQGSPPSQGGPLPTDVGGFLSSDQGSPPPFEVGGLHDSTDTIGLPQGLWHLMT